MDDDQGGQVFSQALMNSNRYGDARSAYRDVQERHRDIKNIEKTLTELAQLFNDVSLLSRYAPMHVSDDGHPLDEYLGRTTGRADHGHQRHD